MTTGPIIETFDVSEDICLRLGASLIILEMDMLIFQGAEEALHRGIIITVARAAHADLDLIIGQSHLIGLSRILAAAIAVMQEAWNGTPVLDSHLEGFSTRLLSSVASIAQPTILRENKSITTARYSQPSAVGM
jgi:hypothetical protein